MSTFNQNLNPGQSQMSQGLGWTPRLKSPKQKPMRRNLCDRLHDVRAVHAVEWTLHDVPSKLKHIMQEPFHSMQIMKLLMQTVLRKPI